MNETNIFEVTEKALINRDYKRILIINNTFERHSFSLVELKELSSKIEQQINNEIEQVSSDEISIEFLNAIISLSRKIFNDITSIEQCSRCLEFFLCILFHNIITFLFLSYNSYFYVFCLFCLQGLTDTTTISVVGISAHFGKI